jgi:hypothetical protein
MPLFVSRNTRNRSAWLMFIDRFIYMYTDLIWTSSLLSGNLCPYSSPGIPGINLSTEIPSLGKLTKNLKKDLKAQVLVILYEEEWASQNPEIAT